MTNAFDFFDLILCINLDRREDRWALVQKEFDSIGILDRVQRFPAIDHSDPGEGCRQSHVGCVKLAMQKGAENVLIFEDDVRFLTSDLTALSQSIEDLKTVPDWQLFFLGGRLRDEADHVTENLFISRLWGTHSYAIDRSAFGEFLNAQEPIDLWAANTFRSHVVNPILTLPASGFSDIEQSHRQDEQKNRHLTSHDDFSGHGSEELNKSPILVISPTPTHPQNAGNRCRIFKLLKELQNAGFPIHFFYTGNECRSGHVQGPPDYQGMAEEWDRYFFVPKLPRPFLYLASPLIRHSFSSPEQSTATSSFLSSRYNLLLLPFFPLRSLLHMLRRPFPDITLDWRHPIGTFSLLCKALSPRLHLFSKELYWKVIKGSTPPEPAELAANADIDDWYNRGIDKFIRLLHKEHRYKTALAEYVFMSAALLHFEEETIKIIDTHDVFSGRSARYQSLGIKDSFFSTSRHQERRGLDRADIVIAIQEDEANTLSQLTEAPIATIGHPVELATPIERKEGRNNVLYIGAGNTANIQAMKFFFQDVFPSLRERFPNLSLILAGSICDHIEPTDGCILLGEVPSVNAAYEQADVVINPVMVGTGLKIKNVEALGFAKPLITTAHGSEGMGRFQGAYKEANTPEEFVHCVAEVLENNEVYKEMSQSAFDSIKKYNDDIVMKLKFAFKA